MALTNFSPIYALVGQFNFAKEPLLMIRLIHLPMIITILGWGVVLGAAWNIDYSVLVSEHRRASAQLDKQRAQYDALVLKTRLDVIAQVGELQRRRKEMDIRKGAMKAAKGWLVSNTLNFGLGLTKTNELLKSLVSYSKTRLAFFSSVYEYNLAVARLSQSVGTELALPPLD